MPPAIYLWDHGVKHPHNFPFYLLKLGGILRILNEITLICSIYIPHLNIFIEIRDPLFEKESEVFNGKVQVKPLPESMMTVKWTMKEQLLRKFHGIRTQRVNSNFREYWKKLEARIFEYIFVWIYIFMWSRFRSVTDIRRRNVVFSN